MPPRLSLKLLGGFRAEVGSRQVSLPRKARALLAYLALSPPGPHSRPKLAGLLWGNTTEEQARNSLRQAVFLIRRALLAHGLEPIAQDADTVMVDLFSLDIDVLAFARRAAEDTDDALGAAATLYGGPLLDGTSVAEPAFETWLTAERARLHEIALTVLQRTLSRRLASGALEAATVAASRLLALDPLHEPAHRALMRLYASRGRRSDALRQFRVCADILRRELGVEPEMETRAIHREILGRPALRAGTTRGAPLGETRPSSDSDRLALGGRWPTIGRDQELSILRALVQGVGARLVAVLGEAGIGKSQLLQAIASEAEQAGVAVLRGRGYETERILPFGVWVGAFRGSGIDAECQALRDLAPAWRAELARLMPELAARGRPGAAGAASYLRLFEAVARLLLSLARARSVLVALEDLHWADETTVRLLAFLARRVDGAAVYFVVTLRAEEVGPGSVLRGALDELRGGGQLIEIGLAPLSEPATAQLVRLLAPRKRGTAIADITRAVWRLSGGHPLAVVEAVKTMAADAATGAAGAGEIPERVRQLILEQLGRLDERARSLVSVAAVIGRPFDFRVLREAAGLDEAVALESLDVLLRRRVFRQDGDGLDLSHDRIREVAYGEIGVARQRLLHARVAAALEARHAGDLASQWGALAVHYREGLVWDKALEFLRAAASQAAARGAYREAAVLFDEALAAGTHLGDSPGARGHAIEIHVELRDLFQTQAERTRAAGHLAEADRLARALRDDRRRAFVLNKLSHQAWLDGHHGQAIELGRELATMGRLLGDPRLEGSGHLRVGQAANALGDHPVAIESLALAAAILEGGPAYGSVFPIASLVADMWRTASLVDVGRFDEAIAVAERTLAAAERANHIYSVAYAKLWLGRALLDRGDVDRAVPWLEQSHTLILSWHIVDIAPVTAVTLGQAWVLAGRHREGLELLAPLSLTASANSSGRQARKAEAYLEVGRTAEAREIAEAALARAREFGERGHEARLLCLVGDSHAAAGSAEAARCYVLGLELAGALGLRPTAAQCRLGLGAVRVRHGERQAARAAVAQAMPELEALGMARGLILAQRLAASLAS